MLLNYQKTTSELIEIYRLGLEISKENISRLVNFIEMWLTLNEPSLNSSETDQLFRHDEEALGRAKRRLEELKSQLAELQ